MANSETIDQIISDKALAELDSATAKVALLAKQFNDLLPSVAALNAALGGNQSLAAFNRQLQQAALAQERLTAAQNRAAITTNQLNQSNLRLQQAQANQQRQQERQTAATQQASTEYGKLLQRQRDLNEAARQAGAAFGIQSDQFKQASASANNVNREVAGINRSLGSYRDNVGNYASAFGKAFGVLRTAANILPGIGISGIILAFATGIEKVASLYFDFSNAVKIGNEVASKSIEIFAKQASQVKLLSAEVERGALSQGRSLQIIDELNKISPTYFGNLKSQDDLYKLLPADIDRYNTALKLSSRIQAESALIAEEYKKQLQAQLDVDYTKTAAFKSSSNIIEQLKYIFTLRGSTFGVKEAENAQKRIAILTQDYLKDSDKLKAAGGPVDGSQQQLQNKQVSDAIENQKILLQRTIDTNNAIAENNKKSYAARLMATAAAYSAERKLSLVSQQSELLDTTKSLTERAGIIEKYRSERLSKLADYQKAVQGLNNDRRKQQIDNVKTDLENAKTAAKTVVDDDNSTYDERMKALKAYNEDSAKLIKANYRLQLSEAGENGELITAASKKQKGDFEKLKLETQQLEQKIDADRQKQLQGNIDAQFKILSERQKQELANMRNAGNERLIEIAKQDKEQKQVALKEFSDGEINYKQYQDKLNKIDVASSQKRIEVQLATLEKLKATQEQGVPLGLSSPEDVAKTQDEIDKIRAKSEEFYTKIVEDNVKKRYDALKSTHELEKEIADSTIQLAGEIIDKVYQRQLDKLTEISNQIDKNASQEKEAIDRSLISSKDKAKREAELDKQTQNQKDAISAQQKKLQKEEAEVNAIIQEAQIIAKTAGAVFDLETKEAEATASGFALLSNPLTAAYAPVAFGAAAAIGGQIAAVIALGAIQAAAVAIPAFEKGTMFAPGGLSRVSEKGSELVIEPSGKSYLTPETESIIDLKRGSKVIPAHQVQAMMGRPERIQNIGGMNVDFSRMEGKQDESNKWLKKIADKRTIIQQGNGKFMRYHNSYFGKN